MGAAVYNSVKTHLFIHSAIYVIKILKQSLVTRAYRDLML